MCFRFRFADKCMYSFLVVLLLYDVQVPITDWSLFAIKFKEGSFWVVRCDSRTESRTKVVLVMWGWQIHWYRLGSWMNLMGQADGCMPFLWVRFSLRWVDQVSASCRTESYMINLFMMVAYYIKFHNMNEHTHGHPRSISQNDNIYPNQHRHQPNCWNSYRDRL